jgi:hypothetical protein
MNYTIAQLESAEDSHGNEDVEMKVKISYSGWKYSYKVPQMPFDIDRANFKIAWTRWHQVLHDWNWLYLCQTAFEALYMSIFSQAVLGLVPSRDCPLHSLTGQLYSSWGCRDEGQNILFYGSGFNRRFDRFPWDLMEDCGGGCQTRCL